MKRHMPAHSCTIKQLPAKELYRAAQHAVSINPANAIPFPMDLDKQAIAVLTSKYWGPAGVHLTVGFLSQASAALQEKIVATFNKWSSYCNASFDIIQGAARNADIRISLGGGGYWSYLGTDVQRISSSQPTMNLQGFSLSTQQSEYDRVVTHEVAHTMGCPHEHMRATIINRLDVEKTIAEFMRTQGWSRQDVIQQIFTPLSEQSIRGTPNAQEDSIMCYWFPGTCTKNGKPILGGNKITDDDGAFMGTIYPRAVTPPPNPPAGTLSVTVASPGYKSATVELQKA